jgi:hypothetical protein
VVVTGHHLILSLAEGSPGGDSGHRELWLLHSNLAAVGRGEDGRSGSIALRCNTRCGGDCPARRLNALPVNLLS